MTDRIAGVILAGGANKRFGGLVKANLRIGGVPIIKRITTVLEEIFSELIIVTNTPAEFSYLGNCLFANDQYLNAGPLAGIHAGLKCSSREAVFVIAGDMPFPDKELISRLVHQFTASAFDILVPSTGNLIEPLHAIYKRTVISDLEEFISNNLNKSVRDFLETVNTGYIDFPGNEKTRKAFKNINSPEDLPLAED
jgi:molybdenum cofactor guanylyltransferase